MNTYQVMPDLSPDEYAELKADISERGVMIPIEMDEFGNILDGHHRLKICKELGITDYPTITRKGWTESQKRTHARKLNIARRHLNREQRQELIREQLKETPERSDNSIAKDLGVSDKTVTVQRKMLETASEIPNLNTSLGLDGKEYPRQIEHKSKQQREKEHIEALKERVEQREKEIQESPVVDFQAVRQNEQDREYIQNSQNYDNWKEFEALCRAIKKFADKGQKELHDTFRMAGMWGMKQNNKWQEADLNYYMRILTDAINSIRAEIMEVLADGK